MSRTFLISDDNSYPLEILASFFPEPPSILYSNEISIIDSLEMISENDVIFWEKGIPFTNQEKEFISNFNNSGGALSVFSKNIDDNDFYIENFGGTFLRYNNSNIIFNETDTINFLLDIPTIELQHIDLNSNIFFKYSNFEISSIQNHSSNFILNGFWLQDISQNQLSNFIIFILSSLNQNKVELSIGSVDAEENSSIIFPIELSNQQNIKNIDFILNIENDYLSNLNIIPTERSIGLDWQIIDLPFGNFKIIANYNFDYIRPGQGEIAIVEANQSTNAVGKISLEILESIILDSSNNELFVNQSNGEISFAFDLPLLYFSENNSVQLGQNSSVELSLKNDMPISGFQLCFEFDSANILFIQGIQSDRIPEDWWVGQFGQGSNNEIQFASLGWTNLPVGDGPIMSIEFLSVGENQGISEIGICDTYLLNNESEPLDNQDSNASITIYSPEIFITPQIIQSQNYIDLILFYHTNDEFSGFQIDLLNIGEPSLYIFNYFGSYITENLIDGTTNRILSFNQNGNIVFPENGSLFVVSFNYLNSLENYIEFDNLMFSDNQGEIINCGIQPIIFNEFLMGDIDGNGELDIKDLLFINQIIISDINIGLAQLEISDIDLDGSISIIDIITLLQNVIR